MTRNTNLKRRSFLVDEKALARAKQVLGVATDAEVVRRSVARIAEMERFWRSLDASRGDLKRGSFRKP